MVRPPNLQRLRERWVWLDRALVVHERFGAIGGGPLSSSITLATFVSLFPLLLVLISVIGFLSHGDSGFTSDLISQLGLQGDAAQQVEDAITVAESSRQAASVIGLLGLLWAGLAVVSSMQTALNAAWQVTGRGLLDRAVALRWLLGAGTLFLATAALGPALSWLPGPLKVLNVAVGAALSTLLFLWTYTSLGNNHAGWRAHLPGAILVAIGFEVLKVVGATYLPRAIGGSSALYGSIGIVFATLAWLAFYARLIVYGAALNVVRYEAAAGTVTVELEVPRVQGEVPLTATRGGAVDERVTAAD